MTNDGIESYGDQLRMLARAVDPEQLSLEKLLVCASEEPFVDNSVKLHSRKGKS